MKKKTIVVGYSGQDGSLLFDDLKKRGDDIIGIGRKRSVFVGKLANDFSCDITNLGEVTEIIKSFQPSEIYYLATHHTSSEGAVAHNKFLDEFKAFQSVNIIGLLNFLSGVSEYSQQSKLFYASSSLVFDGNCNHVLQNEFTPIVPREFYGMTKAQGMWLCRYFRERYGIFVSTGILYNHESHLRSESFLTSKIIKAAIRISRGSSESLEVGNLSAVVDWGYAKDYVSAFQRILAYEIPEDFIVATGEPHSVGEFINLVFNYFDLDPKKNVIENQSILSRVYGMRIGDSTKLRKLTGWKPSLSFENFVIQLIKDHVNAEG